MNHYESNRIKARMRIINNVIPTKGRNRVSAASLVPNTILRSAQNDRTVQVLTKQSP